MISWYLKSDVVTKVLNGDFNLALEKIEQSSGVGEGERLVPNEDGTQLTAFLIGAASLLSWQERLSKNETEELALRLVKTVNIFAFMEEVLKLTNAGRFDERFYYRNFKYSMIPFDVYYALRDNNPEDNYILGEIENFDSETLKTLLVFLIDSKNIKKLDVKFFEPILRAVFKTSLVPDYQIFVCLLKSQI